MSERCTKPHTDGIDHPALTSSAFFDTAMLAQISAAPPPYTTRLSRTRLRTTHSASCNARLASSMIYDESHQYLGQGPCKANVAEIRLLRTDHLVASPDEHCHRPCVGALLNDQHLLPRRSKRHLPDQAGMPQLVRRQVLEPGNDPAVGGDGNELWRRQRGASGLPGRR